MDGDRRAQEAGGGKQSEEKMTGSAMKKRTRREKVRDRMSVSPFTIGPEDSLQEAIDLLHKHNIRELPVVDNGRLVGIVTDRDLREISPCYPLFRDPQEIAYHLKSLKVSTAMTIDPLVIAPDAPLAEAARLLCTYRIGSLPVVEKENLVGIISVTDLLKAMLDQWRGQDRPG